MVLRIRLVAFVLAVWIAGAATVADAGVTPATMECCLRASLAQPKRVGRGRPRVTDAEKVAAEARGTTDAAAAREFWQRFDRVQAEFTERQLRPPMWHAPGGRIAALIDKAHVGLFFTEDGPTRYFALHLQVGNETGQALSIPRDKIHAVIHGDTFATREVTPPLVHHGFPYGTEYFALEACQPAKELTVPARGVAATWLIYGDLPAGQTLPPCQITVQVADRALEVPANTVQHALLDVSIERMGPQQSLALLTLGGMLNTFNMYGLVDDVESLTTQKVNRLVLQWKPKTPQPESQLLTWLQNSALGAGTSRSVSEHLPAFPAGLREMHLVEPSPGTFLAPEYTARPHAPLKVHGTAADAVAAALRTLYVTLPRDDLLKEIRHGHRLSSAAALVHGTPRLAPDDLPLVLELSRADDADVRRAALLALGDFDDPAAFDRLEAILRDKDEADAATATAALSDSRYQAARDRLAGLLKAGDAAFRRRMVAILAQRPRAEWADLFVDHARDEQGRLQTHLIRALASLNDPRLVDLLAPALNSSDKELQDLAFQILSERHDDRTERLVTDFVLDRLQTSPPDALMMVFLSRTKEPRAVPLLLKHLDGRGDKAPLINLLGQIGDSSVGDALIRQFDRLQPNEQVAALISLRQLRHARFVEIAGKALAAKQDVVVSHAVQGLSQHGGQDAERLLCDALQTVTRPPVLEIVALSVANLGTTGARQALQQARLSPLAARRNAAVAGLDQLRRASPGYNSLEQGYLQSRNEDTWNDALESYRLAAQMDPQLPEAYTGQGDIHLKRGQYPKAEAAFAQAYRLDPANGLACSGLGIAQVMQGRLEEGLNTVEKVRAQFPQDLNYSYNVACFYGRAIEKVSQQPPSPERDARLAKYREQALADLAQAVKLGFRESDWMQKDPDLNSLHDLPEFQKIVRDAERTQE